MPNTVIGAACSICGKIFMDGSQKENWENAQKCEKLKTPPYSFEEGDLIEVYNWPITKCSPHGVWLNFIEVGRIIVNGRVVKRYYRRTASKHLPSYSVEILEIIKPEGEKGHEHMIGRLEKHSELALNPIQKTSIAQTG
jgi:hypothetical protein